MKKQNLLKLALVSIAMMVFTGAWAQNPPAAPYAIYDADELAPTNVDYVTLKTGGTTMGYYALPDPVYHPAGTITADFVWNWTIAPVMTMNKPGDANYVEIVYTATGDYQVTVAEQAPVAFGGCTDGDPTIMNVTVVSPPTFTISAPALADICDDQAAQTITVAIVENVPVSMASYGFLVTEEIDEIDETDAVINDGLETDLHDFTLAAKLKTTSTPALAGAQPNYTWGFNTAALTVNNSNRTRYIYRFKKANDAPAAAGEGFVSAISQKSDYITPGIAALNTYAFASGNAQVVISGGVATITYIVNPTPSTGPIYHIPNDYAY